MVKKFKKIIVMLIFIITICSLIKTTYAVNIPKQESNEIISQELLKNLETTNNQITNTQSSSKTTVIMPKIYDNDNNTSGTITDTSKVIENTLTSIEVIGKILGAFITVLLTKLLIL